MASMKNAASSEKMAISDDIAYSGTLSSGPLSTSICLYNGENAHDHDPHDSPLKRGFTIIL